MGRNGSIYLQLVVLSAMVMNVSAIGKEHVIIAVLGYKLPLWVTPWKKSLKSQGEFNTFDDSISPHLNPGKPQEHPIQQCAKWIWNLEDFSNKKTHFHKNSQKRTKNSGAFCTFDYVKLFFKHSGTPANTPNISLNPICIQLFGASWYIP